MWKNKRFKMCKELINIINSTLLYCTIFPAIEKHLRPTVLSRYHWNFSLVAHAQFPSSFCFVVGCPDNATRQTNKAKISLQFHFVL